MVSSSNTALTHGHDGVGQREVEHEEVDVGPGEVAAARPVAALAVRRDQDQRVQTPANCPEKVDIDILCICNILQLL